MKEGLVTMKTRDLVIGALLTALALIIPIF